jgi:hypothetical protein
LLKGKGQRENKAVNEARGKLLTKAMKLWPYLDSTPLWRGVLFGDIFLQ